MTHKIGFDIRMINRTGIGTYIRCLLKSFIRLGLAEKKDLCLFGSKREDKEFAPVPLIPFRSKIYSVFEQLEYPMKLGRCRLWHAPHYNVPILKGRTPLVVTIHDMIHWIYRNEFHTAARRLYAEQMFSRAVNHADQIITVSKHTRDDLIHYFKADPEKISVVYEGVHPRFEPIRNPSVIAQVRRRYQIPEAYFLYVGMLKPHKNVLWLVDLFRELRAENQIGARLVVVGRKDRRYPENHKRLARIEREQDVIYIPYVHEEELIALYNGATALVHPSLYEGFGLTLLEAMACGTPVLACRVASIPEIAGEAACLVNPARKDEMKEAMLRLLNDRELGEEFRRKGIRHVKHFSWDRAAYETFSVYKKILGDELEA